MPGFVRMAVQCSSSRCVFRRLRLRFAEKKVHVCRLDPLAERRLCHTCRCGFRAALDDRIQNRPGRGASPVDRLPEYASMVGPASL